MRGVVPSSPDKDISAPGGVVLTSSSIVVGLRDEVLVLELSQSFCYSGRRLWLFNVNVNS